jgi:hypothetical protein
MAKKKVTHEELIVSFFTAADLSSATTLFNVVKGLMNTRNAGTPAAPKVVKATRKTAAAAAAAPAAAVAEQAAA